MAVLGPSLPADLHLEARPPCEWVPVDPDSDGDPCVSARRGEILVDAMGDGDTVPADFLSYAPPDHWEPLLAAYARSRTWGAAMVAGHLGAALHAPAFFRVNTARVLLDFDRLPGVSASTVAPSRRCAIHAPFDAWMTAIQHRDLLDHHYDAIAQHFDNRLKSSRVVLSIRTSEERDAQGRRRPPVALASRCHVPSLPPGRAFAEPSGDPLFPAELLESTADRALRAHIAEVFEDAGYHVVENYPHLLPEGCLPARIVAKYFFWRVRSAFERLHPDPTPGDLESPRALVWRMLADAEHRSGDGELLRGYLHRLQRPPAASARAFAAARTEYRALCDFVDAHRDDLIEGMRRGPDRVSVLVVEIRKDLVWRSVDGPFGSPRPEQARSIARLLARGVAAYADADAARSAAGVRSAPY
jgi:hypothetical protein